MRYVSIVLTLVLAMAFPAKAQQADIQSVINQQLDALQSDEFDDAFSHASPNIKRLFGSAERFGQMVTNGYPMVYRPGFIRFQNLDEKSGVLFQNVLIQDQQGRYFIAEYAMIETAEGWKIDGVEIRRQEELGT